MDGTTGKYPEFRGNVATFYSNPVSKGGSANGHYGGNAETYMNIGDGMGRKLAELLVAKKKMAAKKEVKKEPIKIAAPPKPKVDPNVAKAERLYKMGKEADRMGQKGAAKTFYQRVVKDYPATPAAERAKERLSKL